MAAELKQFQIDPQIKKVMMARKGATMKAQQLVSELQQLKQMIGMTDQFLQQAAAGMPNEIAQQEV